MNNLKELILSKKSIHFFIIFLSLLRIFVIYFSTKEKSVKISRTYLKRSSLKTRSHSLCITRNNFGRFVRANEKKGKEKLAR